jgi:hypothetical protein
VSNTATALRPGYYPSVKEAETYDADLEPYASLFLKPFATNKSRFTKGELDVMCKDPLHSPRLIVYLIEIMKNL